ncbi:MAG TPA: LuxR family transcriptional regulator [Gemmatimonadaceae bacterium]|nr:LuxR family transcriptional regulator [Gemmatimonadaceae bacterium]
MSDPHRGTELRGRCHECESLHRLLADVREGHSRVLVLRGESGVGKTALLECLVADASGCRIARAAGVESEMELAFAGVHQLCAPLLGHLDLLPAPQRDALRTAFGLSAGAAADRFLVGLAVLSLLSEVAEERTLICVVDDAQWLDRASAQILGFVARRLLAESVAIVFAVRDSREDHELGNLPVMVVEGLSDADSRALLDSATPGRLDERIRDRVVAESNGNPLALLELPKGLTAADLAGGFGRPDARPVANLIEQSFLRRVRALPVESQRLLLTAAAEPVGDVTLLWRAAGLLGIGADAAAPAEAAGLIELGGRVRFRHPLARSAAYRAAASGERQEIHRALAAVTDPGADPDRRAWHRAQAALGPDETVAGELERSADRAQGRGGIAAAAAFLERSTDLTPDPVRRGARALAAAQAKFEAGDASSAYDLLAAAEIGPTDALQRARLARMRAHIVFAQRRGSDAPVLLLDAAKRLEALHAGLARDTYVEALGAEIFVGRLGARDAVRVAEAARAAPPAPVPPRATDLLLDGLATRFTAGYGAGVEPLRRALRSFREQAGRTNDGMIRWLWTACPMAPEPLAADLWDDESWHELATQAVRLAREAGALASLPIALSYRAVVHVLCGEFAAASALIQEADAITEATGNAPLRYTSLALAAWRGEENPAVRLIESSVKEATVRGEGRALGLAGYATAVLYNGLGRYESAFAGARKACEHDDLGFFGLSLVELVEAAVRSGAHDVAVGARRQLEERARAAGTEWALGILARSSALLEDGRAADALYREALLRLGRCRIVVDLARAHLVYGEWLRRENRRVDARKQLRSAYEMLGDMGARAFAERARGELLATGETVRKRMVESRDVLTAQEAMVARLAAQGRTNPEIGAQLFISPRTAEYHLRKVFSKLGISSRRRLRDTLRDVVPTAPSL